MYPPNLTKPSIMLCVFLLGIILNSCGEAQLDNPGLLTSGNEGDPRLINKIGNKVSLLWNDGREATLMYYKKAPGYLKAPITINTNECSERTEIKCSFWASVGMNLFELRWTAHPNPSKIGQVVEFKSLSNPTPYYYRYHWEADMTSADKFFSPTITADMGWDELECEDYSWLPGGGKGAPEQVKIARWDVEKFDFNPETGIMENRSVGGALSLGFHRTGKGTLQLTKVGQFTGRFPNLLTFINALNFVFALSENNFCEVSTLVDVRTVALQYYAYVKILPSFEFEPYVLGKDEYSNFGTIPPGSVDSHGYLPGIYLKLLLEPNGFEIK